jgi:hypothetical protein
MIDKHQNLKTVYFNPIKNTKQLYKIIFFLFDTSKP